MFIEQEFITEACSILPRYHKQSSEVYNFSCNLCGDSATNRSKARAYIYRNSKEYWFHCHNCTASMPFSVWLHKTDTDLHRRYVMASLKDRYNNSYDESPRVSEAEKATRAFNETVFRGLIPIPSLDPKHPARTYLEARKLPSERLAELLFCPEFKSFTNHLLPEKYDEFLRDEPRIIIPMRSRSNKVIGYQGRSLDDDKSLRYITIRLDETAPKMYGLERVNPNKTYYVFEGPIDSMFIPNSIATCGGKIIAELTSSGMSMTNAVVCYDNEPRNPAIIGGMRAAIEAGVRVLIWPDNLENGKDINKMVLSGLSEKDIFDLINGNLYKGLSAQLRLKEYSRL